jgi:hypothetical protein
MAKAQGNPAVEYGVDQIVANIRAMRAEATEEDVRDGRAWYPGMLSVMAAHANDTGLSVAQCAAVYAACSINTGWAQNLRNGAGALADFAAGREPFANGGTLGMIIDKVRRIIAGEDIDATLSADPNNLKIRSFTRNMSGNYDAVTVDRWAMRVAYATIDNGYVPTGAEYQTIADAYRTVAAEFGETPADTQAITWCVIRGTGE